MSKLLLVDDDANTLASLSRAFRLAGHEAVVCDNADRALELARTQRFDMILSDVVMPGKDGLTLLGELKSAGIQTPVVMVSGQANIEMAASETRVCILGETGTGKELVAHTLHDKSPRHSGPFITLNCAAIPAELIESELFGHEKGAFTGATSRHLGKFEQADGGTLFLDEIGDMPVAMQAKLLRVLEEGKVERVGGDKPIRVNVRVVVATHRNLENLVKQNAFRSDLFHRIYVFPLTLPPLRERPEDFPDLVAHFARQVAAQNGWKDKIFTEEAIAELRKYGWPGNVRE